MAVKQSVKRICIFQVSLLVLLGLLIPSAGAQGTERKKVLFVNSYDLDNIWALGTLRGALDVFNVSINEDFQLDDSESPVQFKLFNMKTKKNKSEEFKKRSALEAKALIETWRPDVVICSDDNASKYLIVPYFKEGEIPFVFCGVNWSAEEYGFPASNVTGMIEVFPVQEGLNILKPYVAGDRIGFLSNDSLSERKNAKYIREIFGLDMEERFVNTMDEMEAEFLSLQQQTDMVMIIDVVSLKDHDGARKAKFFKEATVKPTFAFSSAGEHMDFLLICKRMSREQGEWAASAALNILDGTPPADIPLAMNEKAAIRLNMVLAGKLGIKFPMELIERANFVSDEVTR